MFNTQGKLNIFENFRTDRNLPKFKQPEGKRQRQVYMKSSGNFNDDDMVGEESEFSSDWFSKGEKKRFAGRSWWTRLIARLRPTPREPQPKITLEEFFAHVKNDALELAVVTERAAGYEAALKKAKATGQTALFETLKKGLAVAKAETQLVTLGQGRYLDEEKLVEFVKQAQKGLRLDWIPNFTRIIPENVVEKKIAADERGIFDNYVVLHYDPDKKSWAETEAERKKRKDPILFGVMEGSRKLYFVGDWVDEYCDLQLDQIADALGKDAIGTL